MDIPKLFSLHTILFKSNHKHKANPKRTRSHPAPQAPPPWAPGHTHLPGAVAALPGQVLPMGQRARGSAALQGEPRVDERGGSGVVVHKKRLGRNTGGTSQHAPPPPLAELGPAQPGTDLPHKTGQNGEGHTETGSRRKGGTQRLFSENSEEPSPSPSPGRCHEDCGSGCSRPGLLGSHRAWDH